MDIANGVSLSDFTTIGTGGAAREFVEASSREQLIEAVVSAPGPIFVLGGGSNVVISDAGFSGRVVHVANKGIRFVATGGEVLVHVEAGESWDDLVAASLDEGLSGFEAMSGIPGSVGGAVVQNIGAYGQEIAGSVASVDSFERNEGRVVGYDNAMCCFEYRNSVFKGSVDHLILGATFRLERHRLSASVAYAELASKLGVELGERAPTQDVRSAVLELRRGKGMVVDRSDDDSRSAGSFFTNPIIDADAFARLCEVTGSTPPSWPAGEGVKVSAAWLIGRAGFARGTRLGGAGISTKHTLALVNVDRATTTEVLELARTVRESVRNAFGVELEPEPVLLGEQI